MAESQVQLSNFIDGKFVPLETWLDSFDPSTGRVWAKVPDSGAEEVDQAVDAAKRAFPGWSSLTPKQRSGFLLQVADILEKRMDEFALAESKDQGKTLGQARTLEIPRVVLNFRHFANSILYAVDRSKIMEDLGTLNYTVRQPIGVAGLISPWNLPLYLLTFKIAPAIAAGNTVVCKPSEMTSVTAWKLCEILQEAGLPSGVVNMVFGTGPKAGEALVKHPDVSIISFTGSTLTGQRIYRMAAENFKKLSLEMGGKNAGIVFEDADLDLCIPTTLRSSFLNQGEVCLCTSRLFVQRTILDRFLDRFVAQVRKLKVGSPLDPDTFMGALISKEHLSKVRRYVEIAKKEGATVLTGEGIDTMILPEECQNGYFMLPTVITNIGDSSLCMTEEIFGPVVCIVPFDTEESVVKRANALKYGLCASVWSTNAGRILRVSQKLQVGTVWANCWMVRCLDMPFGGCKHSGVGREGTQESLETFTEIKTVCISMR